MKILIFTDNHFCQSYSLINKFGSKYTQRIENQLESLNWVEYMAKEKGCAAVICAGDFFDKAYLTDMELTAINDIKWNNLPHYFLVGNHESSDHGLVYNSTKALEGQNRFIISEPTVWKFENNENEIRFLPYIIESDRKPLFDYFGKGLGKTIIISHNDIKGIQMGPVVSKTGFEINDIDNNCDLFINGHLHNGQPISKKAINLGDLTGKDFGEDAFKYKHNIMILDTDTMTYELIENPYAFNFYQININTEKDLDGLNNLKTNAVVMLKCGSKLVEKAHSKVDELKTIVGSRIILTRDITADDTTVDMSSFSVDHIAKFIECARAHYGNDKILEEELAEVCK